MFHLFCQPLLLLNRVLGGPLKFASKEGYAKTRVLASLQTTVQYTYQLGYCNRSSFVIIWLYKTKVRRSHKKLNLIEVETYLKHLAGVLH